jgi:hypothetical protein
MASSRRVPLARPGLDQQLAPDPETRHGLRVGRARQRIQRERLTLHPQRARADVETGRGRIGDVRLQVVPGRVQPERLLGQPRLGEVAVAAQPVADLEGDRYLTLQIDPYARPGQHLRAAGVDGELQPGARTQPFVELVVHEARELGERATLGQRLQIAFAGVAVLHVAELVTERRHQLGDHRADVGRNPLLPVRVALRREIEQRVAQALEVAREIVDRPVDARLLRAVVARSAVEVARAALLERELDRIEEGIDPGRGVIVDERQAVDLKPAGFLGVDHQNRAQRPLGVGHLVPGQCGDRDHAVVLHGVDPGEAGGRRDREIERIDVQEVGLDQEEHLQPGLHFGVDHPHEVDAGDLRLRLLADQRLAVAISHHSVTSTLRKRRSPRARSR